MIKLNGCRYYNYYQLLRFAKFRSMRSRRDRSRQHQGLVDHAVPNRRLHGRGFFFHHPFARDPPKNLVGAHCARGSHQYGFRIGHVLVLVANMLKHVGFLCKDWYEHQKQAKLKINLHWHSSCSKLSTQSFPCSAPTARASAAMQET